MKADFRQLKVAVVGLRFGGAFPAIYAEHPDVAEVSVCDTDAGVLNEFAEKHGFKRRFNRVEDILAASDIDAVHLITPIHSHAQLTLDVLASGKHCACTVPMATTLDEIRAIVNAERSSGKNYMMMETAVYTYHCLHARQLLDQGIFGRIQFLRGAHYQDMEHWAPYWRGLPPMHYATHAVSPLLYLANARTTKVNCLGSGVMRDELQKQYGNPYPIETALFQLDKDHLAAEVTRSLFHTAHEYAEIFTVFGENGTFDWQMENEKPVLFKAGPIGQPKGRGCTVERIAPGDFSDRLPESIRKYAQQVLIADPANPHQSIMQGGSHHGSHPFMVHEFIRSIVEQRPAMSSATVAANWSAAGICAHESAMRNGEAVDVPSF